ncbi:hypothetical protein [Streptomyces sp. NBC_01207]|uniref:hypothetical protein n=1 Tax=Streptomyces sp. NBC_01207 TaxID=2903772 RepID=UPI002E15EFEA|nr:hypothetical protein OG457_27495 [Streptomyces sp. NBC_01207]
MSLHDTDALQIETATATENLPDPATVGGRTHDLTNTGTVAVAWSSVGALPFTDASGVNVATITVLPGDTVRVQSQASKWRVIVPSGSVRRIFSGSGVSDASGNVTFSFTPPFPVTPNATHAVQTAITDVTECRLTALSASSATFNVRRAPAVVILGISVLQVPVPAVGVTVHCNAITPGQGV